MKLSHPDATVYFWRVEISWGQESKRCPSKMYLSNTATQYFTENVADFRVFVIETATIMQCFLSTSLGEFRVGNFCGMADIKLIHISTKVDKTQLYNRAKMKWGRHD